MGALEGLRWDVLRDGLQILLCSLILGEMICRGWKKRRGSGEAGLSRQPASFSQEVLLQRVRQETEQALAAILIAVETERAKLQPLLAATDASSLPKEIGITPELTPFRFGAEDLPSEKPAEADPYDDIRGLAARGFNARRISEEIGRPVGEVELALRLQCTAS